MQESGFCNLHQHTTESHLDAICDIDDLFDRAKELGQRAIAITDHGSMGGTFKAWKASERTGVKFIPGNEIYFTPDLEAPAKDPETGLKNPLSRRYHLVLLAQTEEGYRNLLRITYNGFKNSVTVMNREFPRVDEEILKKYSKGIIALSACGGNIIAQSIFTGDHEQAISYAKMLRNIYNDDFYIELQPHGIKRGEFSQIDLNFEIKRIAEDLGIKMVATCDAHYIKQSDEKYHDMVLAISDKKALEDLSRHTYTIDVLCEHCISGWADKKNKVKCANLECVKGVISKKTCPEFYLKSENEILDFFTGHFNYDFAKNLVKNVSDIVSSCEESSYIKPSGVEHIPTFDMHHINQCDDVKAFKYWRDQSKSLEIDSDDVAYLKFSSWKGFKEYTKNFTKEKKAEYWKRVIFEMNVYISRGFSSYMLIVADYLNWARKNDIIIGPGRGSGNGSLVAFFIGIHRVDPIKYNLLFERFVNLYKKALPDVDSDIQSAGKAKLYNYCGDKYGKNHVAYISNLNRFTPKVIITDVIRSLMIGGDKSAAFKIAKAITSEIPDKVHLDSGRVVDIKTIDDVLKYSNGELFRELVEENPDILEYAERISGLPRNYSTHAGGVVISDIPLESFVPIRRDKKGAFAVQYEKDTVEEIGLVKMDQLGLSTLDIISEVIEQAKDIGIDVPDLDTLVKDPTDKGAYKIIGSGMVAGCFQLEGSTLQPLCRPIKPENIVDIAFINALGRPSCSKEERNSFIARRNRDEEVKFPHHLLEGILGYTHGISIFEEDLLLLAQDIAGWDLSEADGLRKVTKLKEKGAALADELERKFVRDCIERKSLPQKEAQLIWDDVIIPYSKYGFNKTLAAYTGVIVNGAEVEIRHVSPGDNVLTINSSGETVLSKVRALHDHGEVPMWEVEFNDGTMEECTLDHKWLTDYGQQPLWRIIENELKVFGNERFPKKTFKDASRISDRILDKDMGTREDCDVSRWTMAFHTTSWTKGSQEGRMDIDPIKYGQLRILWRTYKDLLTLPFTYGEIQQMGNLQGREVVRIKYLGFRQGYDLEIDHPSHNFVLSSGLCSSNSHAISYSMIGYATAYYKWHARAPFFAATLNAKLRSKSKAINHDQYISKMKKDAKAFKVSIDACDINKSSQYYVAASKNKIVTGLGAVKGLGPIALNTIIANQPFLSFDDFLLRNTSKVNKNHVASLAKAGAFDSFGVSRKYVAENYPQIKAEMSKHLKKMDISLFIGGNRKTPTLAAIEDFEFSGKEQEYEEWSKRERLSYEKEVLGEYVSGTAKDIYPEFFKEGRYTTSFKAIGTFLKGDIMPFEGMISSFREILIKNGKNRGKTMGAIVVETLSGEEGDILIWNANWEKLSDKIKKKDVPIRGDIYCHIDMKTKDRTWALTKAIIGKKAGE